MKNQIKKIVAMITIIALVFIDYGMSFKAIATETGNFFTDLFKRDSLNLNVYVDEEKTTEAVKNVNDTVTVYLDVTPNIEGYLKTGDIEFKLKDSLKDNFKIKSAEIVEEEKTEEIAPVEETQEIVEEPETEVQSEEIVSEEPVTQEVTEENVVTEEITNEVLENETIENVVENTTNDELNNEVDENSISGNVENNAFQPVGTSIESEDALDSINAVNNNEEFVDSEKVSEEALAEENEDLSDLDAEEIAAQNLEEESKELDYYQIVKELLKNIKLDEENENLIHVENLYKDCKIKVELEYVQDEILDVDNLASDIDIDFSGIFINVDLEQEAIVMDRSIKIDWEYDKNVELESNFVKVAPFTMGDSQGTIVEDEITIRRNPQEDNFLPLKDSEITITIPKLNGSLPTQVDLIAEKLMLSKAEDTNEVVFNENDWSYNSDNQTITIKMQNNENKYLTGEDKYLVSYRYENYADGETALLKNKIDYKATEFSYEDKIITNSLDKDETVFLKAGELITYSLNSDVTSINKGLINANYYSKGEYKAEFTDCINLNILTSDLLDNVIIKSAGEEYLTKAGVANDASKDVKISSIKINSSDFEEILNDSTIDILDATGNVIYTITKDNVGDGFVVFDTVQNDIEIRLNSINANLNTQIQVNRYISDSSYIQSEFVTFASLTTKFQAQVKYTNFENIFTLGEVENKINFKESKTVANLYMNSDYLLTNGTNTNVELRIELNNDKDTSDFYQNPSFELDFPSYVTGVNIKAVSVVNSDGLVLDKVNTENVNGIYKTRIDLTGIQTAFSNATYSNGTNILVTADIDIDDITPRKKDEIKLYYTNDAVTNYESQTTWKIDKVMPAGIIKVTNGFDGATFTYNAPQGMIVANGIYNYDGNYDTLQSVKEGEVSAEIKRDKASVNATMNIDLLNNTGNEAQDVVILGRIPFKGNQDPVTNASLGTNVDTVMKSLIKCNNDGLNVDIYYSTNASADKNLDGQDNNWIKDPTDISQIKSYLIVFKDKVEASDHYSFSYDFEIPANLPFETKILGATSVFYNNIGSLITSYETASADSVILTTEKGAKLQVEIKAKDYNNGDNIKEATYEDFTVTVTNIGSVTAYNVQTVIPKVEQAVLEEFYTGDDDVGNNNYLESAKTNYVEEIKDKLAPDESVTYDFQLKMKKISDIEDTKLNLQAIVNTDIIANLINSEVFSLNIIKANFSFMIHSSCLCNYKIGDNLAYTLTIKDISENTLNNVTFEFKVPDGLEYCNDDYTLVSLNGEIISKENIEYDKNENIVTFKFDSLKPNDMISFTLKTQIKLNKTNEKVEAYGRMILEDGTIEESSHSYLDVTGPILQVTQTVNKDSASEGDEVQFSYVVKNIGTGVAEKIRLYDEFSEYLEGITCTFSGTEASLNGTAIVEDNKFDTLLPDINPNQELYISIIAHVGELGENVENRVIYNSGKLYNKNGFIEEISSNICQVLLNNKNDFKSEYKMLATTKKNSDGSYSYATTLDSNNSISSNENVNEEITDQTTESSLTINTSTKNSSSSNNSSNNNSESTSKLATSTTQTTKATSKTSASEITEAIDNSETQNVDNVKGSNNISGYVWKDDNNNGSYDISEKYLSNIKVELYKDNELLNQYLTDGNGQYNFNELSNGNYQVKFVYDGNTYTATIYKAKDISDELNSDVIEYNNGSASSENITINENNISNISLGLVERNVFDLNIGKYLTKSIVETKKGTTENTYDYKDIAKLEIKSKELNSAKVTLEYTLVIENVGKVDGMATTIIDALPEGTKLSPDDNNGWTTDDGEYIYNTTLANKVIKTGEKIELKVLIEKDMDSESTGIVNNRAAIVTTQNAENYEDTNQDNNTSNTQLIIAVSTGRQTNTLITIIIILLIIIVVMGVSLFRAKKEIYKNRQQSIFKETKKVYK